jgi:hypothetical protein
MSSARVPLSDGNQSSEPDPGQHHHAHRLASAPLRGESRHAQEVWQALAGPLSSASMRLRSVRSQCASGTHESRELDEIIREVDAAFATVMRTPSAPPETGEAAAAAQSRPQGPLSGAAGDAAVGSEPPECEVRGALDRWVQAGCPQRLLSGDTGVKIDALLGQLSNDHGLVPAPTTAALGQDSSCSYARASWLLVWARHASDGPRCRSYRAARYFLADADPAALPAPPERNSGTASSASENRHPKVHT